MRCAKLVWAAGASKCIFIVGMEAVCSACWQTDPLLVPLSKRHGTSCSGEMCFCGARTNKSPASLAALDESTWSSIKEIKQLVCGLDEQANV